MPCAKYARRILLVVLLAAVAARGQVRQNAPVDVVGQVHAPGGGTLPRPVKVNFNSENGFRPPEIHFTDSNGRFVIYNLVQGENYILTIEEEPPNWGLTITRFMPLGRKPAVTIYLNPYKRAKAPTGSGPAVSASTLRADVPGKARREFERGLEQMADGENTKARKRFEKAVALHPAFVEARNELAVLLMKDGELRAAETQLRAAIESDSAAAMPLMNLGLCIYRQQRYAEAVAPLDRAVQLQPESYRAHLLLGMTLVMSGDDPRAEHTLLRAYDLGGARAARAQFYLSHYYTRKKSYNKAAVALETYLRDVPDEPNSAELNKTLGRLRNTSARN